MKRLFNLLIKKLCILLRSDKLTIILQRLTVSLLISIIFMFAALLLIETNRMSINTVPVGIINNLKLFIAAIGLTGFTLGAICSKEIIRQALYVPELP